MNFLVNRINFILKMSPEPSSCSNLVWSTPSPAAQGLTVSSLPHKDPYHLSLYAASTFLDPMSSASLV